MLHSMACLVKFALFLSLCGISLCCNKDWFPFQESCFRTTLRLYDVQMAERYCQLAGGTLARVNGRETLRFLNTLPFYNGENEYWVEKGSFVEDTNTTTLSQPIVAGVDCPYTKILSINYEYCVEKKYFICEMKANPSTSCPMGFDTIGKHCYRPISSQVNYTEAVKHCALQQAQLAVLDTEEEEWEAKASIIGRNLTYLVGAKNDGNLTKWLNGKEFNPVLQIFTDGTIGDCFGLLSEPEHPTVFTWVYVNCTQSSSFLCEAEPMPPTTVEATTPTTTVQPLTCPHGYNWKSNEESGFCFWETTYETERLNWFQAREFCQRYGGDLASYENIGQENSGLGGARGHYKGMWIGLERDKNNVFHWTDGTTLNFTNWDVHEPKLDSKTKFCVSHAASTKWQLDYCGVRRWFICKAPKVKNMVIPDALPNNKEKCEVPGISAYRTQWYRYEDHCYLVQEQSKYTWDTGRLFCQDNGGLMTSIHSFEETNFIINVISLFPDSNFWIGLSAHGLHSSFNWIDSSPLSFTYWADEKTDNLGINSCVNFDKRDGSWNIEHCNRLLGVVCKRGLNATYDLTTTESTTVMPGNCQNGWFNFGNKCYKFFGNQWSQRVDWILAKKACEKIEASLVSIHSQDEQDLLTDIVLEANTDVWIGLRATDGGTVFHWSDDSRMDYTNWNGNEPQYSIDNDLFINTPNELCVEMVYGESDMGKWNDISCSSSRGYICEKRKDPTFTEPYQDPFNCPNISGWHKLGSSCYGFFEKELTWLEAQGECRKYESNLVTYKNSAASVFLKKKLKKKDVYYWIGVREKSENKYESLTGEPTFYTNWIRGQPQAASSMLDNCVALVAENGWLVKSCKEKHPYICRFNTKTEPDSETFKTKTCEGVTGDWHDYGGDYCYMIETDMRKPWGDAMRYCFKHGGYLASIHSIAEIKQIQQHVVFEKRPPSLHIGLGKKSDGSFSWVDNSPMDFTNWDEDEPDDYYNNECAEMFISTGKWRDIDCVDTFRGFICSVPKKNFIGESLPANSSLETENIISQKLTVGGIFGIVICILVILTIIGMTVYYLRPTKYVQPKLLDPEPL